MKLSDIRDLDKEDILSVLGLASKPSAAERWLGSAGVFGLGLLVGAGVALLLAPKSGQDLREDLSQRLRDLREDAEEAADGLSARASESALGREEAHV
jgi:hypothetical protein